MTERMQALMDAAYARWQANDRWSRDQFRDQLDAAERFAVSMGNMNYQVENGGWKQWWDNGYAVPEVVGYIGRMLTQVDTETSKEVRAIMGEFWQEVESIDPKSVDEDEWQDICAVDDELSPRFYKINAQFLKDCEEYIQKTWPH